MHTTNRHHSDMQALLAKRSTNTSFYTCPRCTKVEPSTCKSFQLHDLDNKHKCFACHKLSAVKLWKCKCDVRWHMCGQHQPCKFPDSTRGRTINDKGSLCQFEKSSTKKRRTHPNNHQSYDDILTDEIRRDNKRKRDSAMSDINLGNVLHQRIRVNFLGPVLKKRFKGGTSSSLS